jgi:hypothetical protein
VMLMTSTIHQVCQVCSQATDSHPLRIVARRFQNSITAWSMAQTTLLLVVSREKVQSEPGACAFAHCAGGNAKRLNGMRWTLSLVNEHAIETRHFHSHRLRTAPPPCQQALPASASGGTNFSHASGGGWKPAHACGSSYRLSSELVYAL